MPKSPVFISEASSLGPSAQGPLLQGPSLQGPSLITEGPTSTDAISCLRPVFQMQSLFVSPVYADSERATSRESAIKPLESLAIQPENQSASQLVTAGRSPSQVPLSELTPLVSSEKRGDLVDLFPLEGSQGARMLVVWKGGTIGLFGGSKGTLYRWGGFPGGIDRAAISRDGKVLALARIDTVTLIDTTTQKVLRVRDFRTRIQSISFPPDARSVLLGGADGRIYRWQFVLEGEADSRRDRGRIVERYIGAASAISVVGYHPSSKVFFSADRGGGLIAWREYGTDGYGGLYDEDLFPGEMYAGKVNRQGAAGTGPIEHMEISALPDGRIWIARQSGMLESWLIRGLLQKAKIQAQPGLIHALAVSPDGSSAATVGRDGKVRVISPSVKPGSGDARTSEVLTIIREGLVQGAIHLAWLDKDNLVVGLKDGSVQVLSLLSFAEVPAL